VKWLVLVRAEAEQDLREARDWYEQKRTGLGDEFLDAVANAISELALHADRSRPYFRLFRRVHLRRFPYKIFYQVVGERVIVFRVLHAKQDHTRNC
jgi:toxin ParE1/3/4